MRVNVSPARPSKGTDCENASGPTSPVIAASGSKARYRLTARLDVTAKTYRYVMSHYTGKIEILGISEDNRLWMRYHQARNPQEIGRVFSRPYAEDACWLDDLSRSQETPEVARTSGS